MLKTITGIYRNGQIELAEQPSDLVENSQVIVTFLETTDLQTLQTRSHRVDLATRGISPAQAADLRNRLKTFAQDWDNPDMDIYDDYDNAKTNLQKG